jgi:hypothetical protein
MRLQAGLLGTRLVFQRALGGIAAGANHCPQTRTHHSRNRNRCWKSRCDAQLALSLPSQQEELRDLRPFLRQSHRLGCAQACGGRAPN